MTKVSVISALINDVVAKFDTDVDTLQSVTAKALTFPEVRNAPYSARLEAEALLKSIFDGSFPFRGEFTDPKLSQYGIARLVLTDNTSDELVEDAEGSEWTPVAHPYYREGATYDNAVKLSESPAQVYGNPYAVKSTPADFKGKFDLKSIIVGASALIVGAVAGGLIW